MRQLKCTLVLLLVTYAQALNAPTSSNNPLRLLAIKAPKKEQPLICCLRPLPTNNSAEDDLISFEDWKAKHATTEFVWPDASTAFSTDDGALEPLASPDRPSPIEPPMETQQQPPPHFRIPIKDRFNYASLDCSARVHSTHRSAKSAHSVLSSKKDKYMLSPCGGGDKKKFIIVELCEDIRIDTVQLANFEFFSGVFKDFTVSVAKTNLIGEDGWTFAGSYRAKNTRGVQSFHPPTSLRDFYRFIRIDFQSYYGNEYYCPISLLRVFGLTHLEQWKWDLWEDEYKAKKAEVPTIEHPLKLTLSASVIAPNIATETTSYDIRPSQPESTPLSDTNFDHLDANDNDTPSATASVLPTDSSKDPHVNIVLTDGHSPSEPLQTYSSLPTPTTVSIITQTPSKYYPSTTSATTIITVSTQPASVSMYSSGESIFRTIMNRLTALEFNHTLYARYAQEQHLGVRDALKRITEDVGRLEGIGKAYAQSHQRSLHELEKHRKRIDTEYHELALKVDHLANEIVIEKWLSIAQMILLIAVFVFLGVTRGTESRIPAKSVREWGRRHLSLTSFGGWHGRSRSVVDLADAAAARAHVKREEESRKDYMVEFPKEVKNSFETPNKQKTRNPNLAMSSSRSLTPSSLIRRPKKPITPTHIRPPLVTTLSSTSIRAAAMAPSISWPSVSTTSPVNHKSAKKWARSAHLHPVKRREGKENMKQEVDESEGWVDTDDDD